MKFHLARLFLVCIFNLFSLNSIASGSSDEAVNWKRLIEDMSKVRVEVKVRNQQNKILESCIKRELRKHEDVTVTAERPNLVIDAIGGHAGEFAVLSLSAQSVILVQAPSTQFSDLAEAFKINTTLSYFDKYWHWMESDLTVENVCKKAVSTLDTSAIEAKREELKATIQFIKEVRDFKE